MGELTLKEKIWEELSKKEAGEKINMVNLSKKINCSLAYISSLARYSYESGFIATDENGNYVIKNIPEYAEFQSAINEKYNKYRRVVGRGRVRGSSARVPKDFEISEKNIISVIKKIIQEKEEAEKKVTKLIKYIKKMKKERDDLIEMIEKMNM